MHRDLQPKLRSFASYIRGQTKSMFHNLATSGSDVKTNGILSGIADRISNPCLSFTPNKKNSSVVWEI